MILSSWKCQGAARHAYIMTKNLELKENTLIKSGVADEIIVSDRLFMKNSIVNS